MSVKDMVKDNKKVKFVCYRPGETGFGELVYATEDGFQFPIPMNDLDGATFLAEDKALLFMRWIRKHYERIQKAKADADIQ